MWTEQTTLQLQGEIKRLIQQLGKSQNEAARFIYTETYEFDDDDDWDEEEKENTDAYIGRSKKKPWTSRDQSEYDAFEELSQNLRMQDQEIKLANLKQ